ncbi:AAA family ATPase [Devosia sp. SL43]|nr:AAA family ATPase [Devosia sp. SL43]
MSRLRQVVGAKLERPKPATVRLDDLAGYGDTKAWGLELRQDMTLWREGKLDWDEVDHRAVVLAGPPGTDKTSFAAVLAATLEVPLVASNVAEWNGHKHLSGTLNRMKEVFARRLPTHHAFCSSTRSMAFQAERRFLATMSSTGPRS